MNATITHDRRTVHVSLSDIPVLAYRGIEIAVAAELPTWLAGIVIEAADHLGLVAGEWWRVA